jgi:hypothetical protein
MSETRWSAAVVEVLCAPTRKSVSFARTTKGSLAHPRCRAASPPPAAPYTTRPSSSPSRRRSLSARSVNRRSSPSTSRSRSRRSRYFWKSVAST